MLILHILATRIVKRHVIKNVNKVKEIERKISSGVFFTRADWCMYVHIEKSAPNVCLCVFDGVVSSEIRSRLPVVPVRFLSPGLVGFAGTSTVLDTV